MVGFGIERYADPKRGAWVRKRKGQACGSDAPRSPLPPQHGPQDYNYPPGAQDYNYQARDYSDDEHDGPQYEHPPYSPPPVRRSHAPSMMGNPNSSRGFPARRESFHESAFVDRAPTRGASVRGIRPTHRDSVREPTHAGNRPPTRRESVYGPPPSYANNRGPPTRHESVHGPPPSHAGSRAHRQTMHEDANYHSSRHPSLRENSSHHHHHHHHHDAPTIINVSPPPSPRPSARRPSAARHESRPPTSHRPSGRDSRPPPSIPTTEIPARPSDRHTRGPPPTIRSSAFAREEPPPSHRASGSRRGSNAYSHVPPPSQHRTGSRRASMAAEAEHGLRSSRRQGTGMGGGGDGYEDERGYERR